VNCFMCKGALEEKKTTFMVDLGDHIIIIKDVPSYVCSQCGDTSYSDEVARVLEEIVESLRHAPTEMSVVSYAHRPAAYPAERQQRPATTNAEIEEDVATYRAAFIAEQKA